MDDLKIQDRGWTPVEKAYSLWLRTARETAGSAVALVRTITMHLARAGVLENVPSKWASDLTLKKDADWAGRTIKRWESGDKDRPQPQQTEDERLRNALIAAVTRQVPKPPASMQWATFREVSDAFATERVDRQQRGGLDSESRVVQERDAERHRFLAIAPTPAKLISPVALGLGSWAFDNALPPYVTRTTDQALSVRLKTTGVTTVSGAPKSGKSRSILEALQRDHPEALIWWVNPSPTVLPLVVQAAKKAPKAGEKPTFVILDDAGLIGTSPDQGITAQRVNELSQNCTHLILVIHDETLAGWEHRLSNRIPSDFSDQGLGATHELMDLLKHRIHYNSVLDNTEISRSSTILDEADDRIKSFDLTRIAETFAGVQTLLSKARRALETPTSMDAALIEAAIDASICFPSGTTPEILALLAATHYRKRQPNRPWRPQLLDEALDTLTTGITTGSPHAILTTTNHTTYRLMDALVPELQHPNRNPLETLTTSQLNRETLGRSAFLTGLWLERNNRTDQAHQAWTTAADAGNTHAKVGLGVAAYARGKTDEATIWWKKAADAGNTNAMDNLGITANERGKTDEAITWWKKAADAGNTHAMNNLGVLANNGGKTDEATTWLKKAAKAGNTHAMYDFGVLANNGGKTDEATTWWRKAADAGNTDAMNNLGVLANNGGKTDEATTWWRKAAKAGNTNAMHNLGLLSYDHRGTNEATTWWKKAPDAGNTHAMYSLGYAANERGETDEARMWWENAARAGHTKAMIPLGITAYRAGDIRAATVWLNQADEYGSSDAMNVLEQLSRESRLARFTKKNGD